MSTELREMTPADWPHVSAIYAEGIAGRQATFETEVPSWEAWDASHLSSCRIIACDGGEVVGWAALSPVSNRCVYAGVAEVSVYVSGAHAGRGIGRTLLDALVAASEAAGIWTLEAQMFVENHASVALHLRCGFETLGVRKRLGKLDGAWRDVVFMERRSEVVGV
jgi:phosphinothricin acetyltransferase